MVALSDRSCAERALPEAQASTANAVWSALQGDIGSESDCAHKDTSSQTRAGPTALARPVHREGRDYQTPLGSVKLRLPARDASRASAPSVRARAIHPDSTARTRGAASPRSAPRSARAR